jgi:hypothetical protein
MCGMPAVRCTSSTAMSPLSRNVVRQPFCCVLCCEQIFRRAPNQVGDTVEARNPRSRLRGCGTSYYTSYHCGSVSSPAVQSRVAPRPQPVTSGALPTRACRPYRVHPSGVRRTGPNAPPVPQVEATTNPAHDSILTPTAAHSSVTCRTPCAPPLARAMCEDPWAVGGLPSPFLVSTSGRCRVKPMLR